jgi:16S rRNA (uracil1498-N3)-methyltransferase
VSSPRIVIPSYAFASGREVEVPPDKSHYLLAVMRVKRGGTLVVTDGAGKAFDATVTSTGGGKVLLRLGNELPSQDERAVPLVLCQAILKGPKMELVVQKATELGASELVPVITDFCVVRETRKTARWRKIAEEAAEQCGRATVPHVHEPTSLTQLLQTVTDPGLPSGLVFWEQGGLPVDEALDRVALPEGEPGKGGRPVRLLIGPEGGLSADEVAEAGQCGFVPVTLGRRTFRAETASLVAVALVDFLLRRPRRA